MKNKKQLTLEQVEVLTNTAEELLPVLNKAKTATRNDCKDGCCTALPIFWVADYSLKDAVDYQRRAYDLELFGWLLYRESMIPNGRAFFTDSQELVGDDDLTL